MLELKGAPKLELYKLIAAGAGNRVPLRQFAVRLQSAIAQAATVLIDRQLGLTFRCPELHFLNPYQYSMTC